jgi:hypothetical protein
MATADEAALARTPLGADLKAGIDAISYNQSITFTRFVRLVLPLDGYVFWVRGDLATPPSPGTLTVMGSFHYATEQLQEESESYSRNKVIFTAQGPVDSFNQIDPDELYIATYDGLQFAFSTRGNFYNQAQVWHYVGNAIYSDMQSQIITSAGQLTDLELIVSNSLPVWIALNSFAPNWPFYPTLPLPFKLYPSFLAPQNISPPWGTVHIEPDDTNAIASAPGFSNTLSQTQLSYDKVTITLWGANNKVAQNFVATVNQFSIDTGLIGVMSHQVMRDEKRTQSELGTIAQKKTITYEVSYIQSNIVNFTRQLLASAIPTYLPQAL